MKREKVIVCMLTAMLSVGGILTACGDKRSDETKENSNTKKRFRCDGVRVVYVEA